MLCQTQVHPQARIIRQGPNEFAVEASRFRKIAGDHRLPRGLGFGRQVVLCRYGGGQRQQNRNGGEGTPAVGREHPYILHEWLTCCPMSWARYDSAIPFGGIMRRLIWTV